MKLIFASFAFFTIVLSKTHASSPYEVESALMQKFSSVASVKPYKKAEKIASIAPVATPITKALDLCTKNVGLTLQDQELTEAYLQLCLLANGYYPGALSPKYVSDKTKSLREEDLLHIVFSRLATRKMN